MWEIVKEQMTTIKTPAGEILALRIPKQECDDFEIIRDQDNYDQKQLKYPSDTFQGLQNYSWINLPEGNWEIVGTISHDGKFGFDPTPFIPESQGEILWGNPIECPSMDDYDIEETDLYCGKLREWQSNEAKRVKENELILIIVNR